MRGYKKTAFLIVILTFCLQYGCQKDFVLSPIVLSSGINITSNAGFFLDNWQPKIFEISNYVETIKEKAQPSVTVTVNFNQFVTKVPKYIFGNNANTYMGQMISEPLLIDEISKLSPNVIRYPGGNVSSTYFWNADKKPTDIPLNLFNEANQEMPAEYWFGKNNDSWTLSLDNYYQMLQKTGSKGIITVNYGYARYGTGKAPVQAAAHLAAEWVRYDKGRTKFWEIGNESFGAWQPGFKINLISNKDGQPEIMSGSLYGKHFKIFCDSMRKAATEIGNNIKIGGQLIESDVYNSSTDVYKNWNSGFFTQIGNSADFFIVHSYYTPYKQNSGVLEILNTAVTNTKDIMSYMKATTKESGVILKPIALTEWNIFSEGSKQQVSHIAGVHAAIVLGELIKNQYGMASRWNLANGYSNGDDQGMFSLGDENDGTTKWTPRPAFYQMYFFQKYFGDHMVSSSVVGNSDILSYASGFSSGEAGLVLINKSSATKITAININDFNVGKRYYYYVLTGGVDNGDFSRKEFINGIGPEGVSGGPKVYQTIKAYSGVTMGGIKLSLPPFSVIYLVVAGKNAGNS